MICDQTPVLPLIAHDSFSHVSLPNSPGRGIVLNVHSSLPLCDVPRAHEALGVVVRLDGQAFAERRADDHDVLRDGRRRVQADLARLQIDLLALADHARRLFMSTTPFLPNPGTGTPVFAFSATRRIAGRHVDDAVVALAVGPVGQAAARELARRVDGARAFALRAWTQISSPALARRARRPIGACRRSRRPRL